MSAMAPACATCMALPASCTAAFFGRSLTSIIGLPAADASDGTETASLDDSDAQKMQLPWN